MSFIRMNQDSKYVDLRGGSRAYIYDHGSGIDGFGTYAEFIDALCIHAEEAGLPGRTISEFERALENHYGEKRGTARAIGQAPEMAHIIAQHLDSRLDDFSLAPQFRTLLQEHADSAYVECSECGDEWRPDAYTPDEQGDMCKECYDDMLRMMDVTADMSDALDYVDELPDDTSPGGFHDDEFYALVTEAYMSAEGQERQALHLQLGLAADEIQDAHIEDRPANKDYIRSILESVHE